MNPVALYFASGESLYGGAGLLLALLGISRYLKQGWLSRLRNVGAWTALALMVMACPPFPWVVDGVFLAAFMIWFISWNRVSSTQVLVRLRFMTALILALMLVVFSAVELSHRKMPSILGATSDQLVVIGDSISSGLDPRVPSWPSVFEKMTDVRVKNLARPGAQASDGMAMAERLSPEDHVILIEIGGNDLLAGVPPSEFAQGLEATLAKTAVPGRTIVMFELPLLPHRIAYGQIQRRLATRYGVWLIPKRFFTDVIHGTDATSDGLHLSPNGARRMSALIAHALSRVLQPGLTARPIAIRVKHYAARPA
jgi:lysophospholipase L1-like esterase